MKSDELLIFRGELESNTDLNQMIHEQREERIKNLLSIALMEEKK